MMCLKTARVFVSCFFVLLRRVSHHRVSSSCANAMLHTPRVRAQGVGRTSGRMRSVRLGRGATPIHRVLDLACLRRYLLDDRASCLPRRWALSGMSLTMCSATRALLQAPSFRHTVIGSTYSAGDCCRVCAADDSAAAERESGTASSSRGAAGPAGETATDGSQTVDDDSDLDSDDDLVLAMRAAET